MAKKINTSYKTIKESLEVFKEQTIAGSEIAYTILKAFGKSNADIRRYQEGRGILTAYKDGLLIKGLFAFNNVSKENLTDKIEEMKQNPMIIKAGPKIIAVSDGDTILAYDMRETSTYENPLSRLYCDFVFFYPLCGIERFQTPDENPETRELACALQMIKNLKVKG